MKCSRGSTSRFIFCLSLEILCKLFLKAQNFNENGSAVYHLLYHFDRRGRRYMFFFKKKKSGY